MKLKSQLLILTVLLGVTITTSFAGDPSAKTKAEKTAVKQSATTAKAKLTDVLPGADVQPVAYFYTGKPYDKDLGGYVFNYRTYSPGLNRWTTTDPSGFPDGANGSSYAPCPTNEVDATGLAVQTITSGGKSYKLSVEDPKQLDPSGAPIGFEGLYICERQRSGYRSRRHSLQSLRQ